MGKQLEIVALSGGADSTALALRLREVYPEKEFTFLCTPTGDELPEMEAHWQRLECLLGQELLKIHHKYDLNGLINEFKALPSWRMRWCTRMLKIETAQAFYLQNPGSIAYVGLRADEEERKGGIYGDLVEQRYPLREWGWDRADVLGYLSNRGIAIPRRTDCARCYDQRLGEWWNLWKDHPEIYENAACQERKYGHTFRSDQRDKWPASLDGLRGEFESGKIPRGADVQGELFETYERKCRVCSM